MRKDGLERVARINLDGSVQISWLGCPFLDREEQNGGTTGASEWGLRGDSFVIFTFGERHYQTKALVLKPEHTPGFSGGLLEHTSLGFACRVSGSRTLE